MYVVQAEDIPAQIVRDEDSEGASIRWLISQPQGAPNFAMRLVEVQPGGHSPYHSHGFEHEVYVLDGTGELVSPYASWTLRPGTVVFVPPDVRHNFRNTADVPLRFICCVPLLS
jgi:quercetin dioxygenase-like cupin family protein